MMRTSGNGTSLDHDNMCPKWAQEDEVRPAKLRRGAPFQPGLDPFCLVFSILVDEGHSVGADHAGDEVGE
jgi:hypothetical protein